MDKVAQKIIMAYVESPDGMTLSECIDAGLSVHQCGVVSQSLGYGKEAVITDDEKREMEAARLSKEFIDELAGGDGRATLQKRVDWLIGNAVKKKSKRKPVEGDREKIISEIGDIGDPVAIGSLIDILQEIDMTCTPVHHASIKALAKIGGERAARGLVGVWGRPPNCWQDAAKGLATMGNIGAQVMVEDIRNSVGIKGDIVKALRSMGMEAIPATIDGLEGSDGRGCVLIAAGLSAYVDESMALWVIPSLEERAKNAVDQKCREMAERARD